MYSYNSYGWLSAEEIPGRTTSVEPPAHGDKVVGELYPNYTGVEWVLVAYSEPPVPIPPAPPRVTILTHLQFRQRFTLPERVAFDNASDGSWTAEQKAMIKTMAEDLRLAQEVDLDYGETIQGVMYLESIGLIGTGRAAEILA